MGNSPKRAQIPYTIVQKKGKKNFYVRGSYEGHRLDTSTREEDETGASRVAAQMWDEHVAWVKCGQAGIHANLESGKGLEMPVVGTAWIKSKGDRLATKEAYVHRVGMLSRHFPLVTDCSTSSVENFMDLRLQTVQRDTVIKDQRVLRSILRFAKTQGIIKKFPEWELPERARRGKPHPKGKSQAVGASPKEVEAILALVPEATRNQRLPAQAICRVLWETGLRPTLLWRVTTPRHWAPGSDVLNITADISKIGLARKVKLTAPALKAMEYLHSLNAEKPEAQTAPGEYLLAPAWGKRGALKHPDIRKALLNAAKPVIGEERAEGFSASSFRPSRITQLLLSGGLPPEVGRMVGQTSSSIQDRYLRVGDSQVDDFWDRVLGG